MECSLKGCMDFFLRRIATGEYQLLRFKSWEETAEVPTSRDREVFTAIVPNFQYQSERVPTGIVNIEMRVDTSRGPIRPIQGLLNWEFHNPKVGPRLLPPYLHNPQQQTCKVCGKKDRFDFHVDDETWQQIVPAQFQNKVVCLACFDGFAALKSKSYHLQKLCFAGDKMTFELNIQGNEESDSLFLVFRKKML